jgi:hypothetical protein
MQIQPMTNLHSICKISALCRIKNINCLETAEAAEYSVKVVLLYYLLHYKLPNVHRYVLPVRKCLVQ